MNSIYNRTDEESSVIGEVQDNFIANYPLYQQGFKAGAASRDAKIQRLQSALADAEALELGTAERCDQLRAQIKMLRDALQFLIATKELKESIGKTREFWLHELQDFAMKEQP